MTTPRPTMTIDGEHMYAVHNGKVMATATRDVDNADVWNVIAPGIDSARVHWTLDRNRAITALMLAGHLASGQSNSDPHALAWRAEIEQGPR